MAMIVMFPWLALEEPLHLGEFELLQYSRGALPAGIKSRRKQAVLDSLFRPYRDTGKPVSSASLLKFKGHDYLDDLDDDARTETFSIAQLLTVGGLSAREFFGLGMFYCNSDHFTWVIQGFDGRFVGAAITRRRRDGRTLNYVPAKSYRVDKPHHIGGIMRTRIDVPLLKALLAARKFDWWESMFESIFWFNRANTDSDTITMEGEAVETIGAFERLLGLKGGDERLLRRAFVEAFSPPEDLRASDSPRANISRLKGCATVREAWIADFFRLRGDHSHGRKRPQYPSIWTLEEHLLLGAYAFPLLLKKLLSARELYQPTREDVAKLNAFEHLASIKPFERPSDPSGQSSWPWNRILAESHFKFPQYLDPVTHEPLIDASLVSWGRRPSKG